MALPGAARAEEPLTLRAVVTQPGVIHFTVHGQPGSRVEVAEIVDSVRRPLLSVVVNPYGGQAVWDAARWTCARSSRRFVATNARGEESFFSVRTPSCRNRLSIRAPARARRGSLVRVRLTDSFNVGFPRARLCVVPPAEKRRCRTVAVPALGHPARSAFRAKKRGLWRVVVRTRHQRTSRTVAVGMPAPARSLPRIFLTGDSMMQSLDNTITDSLAGRAEITSDVFIGSALSKPGFSFVANTRNRARRLKPAATVVFLGANDAYPLRTLTGAIAECCGEPWVAAYARRARRLIRAAGGPTFVFTLPAPRQPDRAARFRAVNEGMRRATAAEPDAHLLDLVPVFTPGFAYRPSLSHRGRLVRVRESDGIHVSIFGATIVSSLVIKALERSKALSRR